MSQRSVYFRAVRAVSCAWCAGLGLVVFLSGGCATQPRTALTLDPVGPITGAAAMGSGRPTGYLEVYSETEPYDDGGFVYYRHTPYSVYDTNMQRVKGVPNRVGMTDQRPLTVPLAAGRYRVFARAEGYGLIEVPVVIAGARLTEVHLERAGMTPPENLAASECVRLPDGRLVGRRAAAGPAEPGR